MTKLQEMNKEYYQAVEKKDWKVAKELLDKITKLQNEKIFAFYNNIKKI